MTILPRPGREMLVARCIRGVGRHAVRNSAARAGRRRQGPERLPPVGSVPFPGGRGCVAPHERLYCRRSTPSRPAGRIPAVKHLEQLRVTHPAAVVARRKLMAGERLTQEDGVRLFDAPVLELGRLADARRPRPPRRPRLLHRQPPAQPHQRVRADAASSATTPRSPARRTRTR